MYLVFFENESFMINGNCKLEFVTEWSETIDILQQYIFNVFIKKKQWISVMGGKNFKIKEKSSKKTDVAGLTNW